MSRRRPDPDPGPGVEPGSGPADTGAAADPVGPVAEEAARLVAALGEWVREHAGDGGAAAAAPHAESCRWCPLCQAIGLVRGASPEVRHQLAGSAGAFVLALRDLLDQAVRAAAEDADAGPDPDVEHIDLSDESGDGPWV